MQSIIVYRNPLEAAFWEAASDGRLFPFIVGFLVFFIVLVILQTLIDKHISWRNRNKFSYAAMVVSAMASCGIIWYLII